MFTGQPLDQRLVGLDGDRLILLIKHHAGFTVRLAAHIARAGIIDGDMSGIARRAVVRRDDGGLAQRLAVSYTHLRQKAQVEQFKRMENRRLPEDLDYQSISALRIEARQKLAQARPLNLGQASRISGVSPADITALMIYLENHTRGGDANA